MKNDSQLKIFLFLERLWMVAAILSVVVVAYFIITGDNDSALFFLGFFVLCGLLYILRKRQRRNHQRALEGKDRPYEPGQNRP